MSKKGRKLWADLADEEDQERSKRGKQAARVVRAAVDMEVVRKLLNSEADVAEAYSPPRVTAKAPKMSMVGVFALDLTMPGP